MIRESFSRAECLNPDTDVLIPAGRDECHAVGREAERSHAVLVPGQDAVMLDLHGVPDVYVVVVRPTQYEAAA